MSRLAEQRRFKGVKGVELAQSIGIHPTALSNAEHRRLILREDRRAKIAEVLELPESKLFNADGLARA
jgi:transcriptional regulator with XRE-family HTH domain